MAQLGRYDANLQMFIEEQREADIRRLRFLRWLGEHGRLEHTIAGPMSGELAPAQSQEHYTEARVR